MDIKQQTRLLKAELLAKIEQALDNTAFCLGPEVEAFEREFAAYCECAHGVGVNSGTSALHLALLALGIKPGDEVITTPFTFVATAWAISYCGATPVFVDIDPRTFLISPQAVEKALTKKTKALLPVHIYGQSAEMEPLLELARKKSLPLVEDCAQAHGATYQGRRVGSFGAISCFSFYPSKNLGACGEGGMALTSDATLAAKLRALRDHGSVKRYYHETIGFNYRLEGLQGAVLRVKLKHLEEWNARRRKLAALYDSLLEGTPSLRCPVVAPNRTHVYHLYVIRHPRRDALAEHLKQHGIGTSLHYPVPVHLQQAYAHLNYKAGSLPNSEAAARECLSLPLFPELTEEQVKTVCEAVRNA